MSAPELALLEQIKWILVAIFACVFILIVFYIIAHSLTVKISNTNALVLLRDNMLAELSLLEGKGSYDEAYALSARMLESYPNDLLANWYFAVASYRTNQFSAALTAFSKVKQINPTWMVEEVDRYITQVKSELTGPK